MNITEEIESHPWLDFRETIKKVKFTFLLLYCAHSCCVG